MRITEAAQRLGTSPRMLRYRDMLGLLPPVREPAPGRAPGGQARGHRRFGDDDLAAVAHALRIEQRYDISPAALAFGLKVLTEPGALATTEDDDFHHADWIIPVKSEKPADCSAGFSYYPGDVLLSHAVAHAVSSAMRSLTAVFGMGTGGASAL